MFTICEIATGQRRVGVGQQAGDRASLKTKASETGAFVITGFVEREAVAVAELRDRVLVPVGQVKFGLASRCCGSGSPRCATAPRPVPASSRCAPNCSPRSAMSGATVAAGFATACYCRSAEEVMAQGVITLCEMRACSGPEEASAPQSS